MSEFQACNKACAAGASCSVKGCKQKSVGSATAQPAPTVQQKPLFKDIIAQHPGLAEELKAMDAAPVPLTDVYAQFNAAIDFAIEQRTEAAVFLSAWREGDTSEWPEFDAHGITEKGQP